MPDKKISQLVDGGASQALDAYVIARTDGVNYKIAGTAIAAAATSVGTLTSLTVSGVLTLQSQTTLPANVRSFNIAATTAAQQFMHIGTSGSDAYIGTAASTGGGLITGSQAYAMEFRNDTGFSFGTGATERMRLDASGNLGIGRTPSGYTLDITTGGNALRMERSGVEMGGFISSGNPFWGTLTNHPFLLMTNGTERARIDASGNLGLGVTPSAWGGGFRAVQMGTTGGYISGRDGFSQLFLGCNSYYDGANWKYTTTATATRYYMSGGEHVFERAVSGTAGNNISWLTSMTLDASGNLGVGTTGPSSFGKAAIVAASGATSFYTGTGAQGLYISTDDSTRMVLYASSGNFSGGHRWNVGNTEAARITAGGYFKASDSGTYAGSTGTYHELRTNASDPTYIWNSNGAPNGIYVNFNAAAPDNNTQYFLLCNDQTAARCYIWSDGDLANHDGVYGTISDERLKQDIVDASSQWDDLKAVRFRKYRMKTDVAADPNAPYQLGVIAQELAQTSPGLVDEHPEYEEQEVTDEDGNVTTERVQVGTTKTVKSSILLMKAAVALQEAMARIESLEARLAALES